MRVAKCQGVCICPECGRKMTPLLTRVKRVNEALYALPSVYYTTLGGGLSAIYDVLKQEGFEVPEVGYSLPKPEGRLHVGIGDGIWLSVSWYRMESGNYEVVAYVN